MHSRLLRWLTGQCLYCIGSRCPRSRLWAAVSQDRLDRWLQLKRKLTDVMAEHATHSDLALGRQKHVYLLLTRQFTKVAITAAVGGVSSPLGCTWKAMERVVGLR